MPMVRYMRTSEHATRREIIATSAAHPWREYLMDIFGCWMYVQFTYCKAPSGSRQAISRKLCTWFIFRYVCKGGVHVSGGAIMISQYPHSCFVYLHHLLHLK